MRRRSRRFAFLFAAALCLVSKLSTADAQLPTGADVVAGQAAISQSGNTLNIQSATARAIVNWDSFNVAAGNVANFTLPDANAAILNRVISANMPSNISGALNSNGHVYLVNPFGIMVSQSGMVNTNGFTASTLDVTNSNFMAGGALSFVGNGSNAAVVNQGTINTGDSGAHLIANQIANSGTITSAGGNITLSGGGTVTLDNGVTYVQPSMETLTSGISPTAGLIQNTGAIRATGAATSGGEVYLVNPNGAILHDGTIVATKANVGQVSNLSSAESSSVERDPTSGGKVQLEADEITLASNSSINATGTHGGGTVLVGGDWQGSGEMTQATTVTMDAGATIDASAIELGDGGKIVLWSDVTKLSSVTKVFGTLIARAGELFGNGGQIETSGHQVDTSGIAVEAGAANGDGGLWLIDPYNYVIDAVAASNIVGTLNTGTSVSVTTTANNAAQGSSGNSSASGDISVTGNLVTGAMAGDATLTLQAARHINIGGSVGIDATQNGNTTKLNVKLWADSDNSGDGINILNAPSIKTNGGTFTSGNGNTANIGGSTVTVGGDLYISSTVAQTIDTAGGNITINGETFVANSSVAGVTFDSGGGDVVFGGLLNSGNQYTYVDGPDGQANSWNWARTDAKNGTAGGSALGDSYLVTITSRLENAIAGFAAGYRGAWIGAYRDTSTPNDWVWADGPEAGQHFFTELDAGGGSAESGWYSNFGPGEPNGGPSASGENVGQFFGDEGLWNDLSASTTFSGSQGTAYSVLGYVRETNLNPTAVTIDAGSTGTVTMGGVGNSKALASLNVLSAGVTVNGNALITTGAQSFNSSLTLNSPYDVTIESSGMTVGGSASIVAAGDLTLNSNIDTSSASGGGITLKAAGDVNFSGNTTLTTDGGDVLVASDSDSSGKGAFTASSAVTVTTGGGNITIGGGADGSGFSTGNEAGETYQHGVRFSGDATLNSGGGDIAVRGKSGTTANSGNSAWGVSFEGNTDINSGDGQILLHGVSQNTSSGAYSQGLLFSHYTGTVSDTLSIISSYANGDAITLIGDASAATSNFADIGILFSSNNASNVIAATGVGGNIIMDGYVGADTVYGAFVRGGSILADSGDIDITAHNNANGNTPRIYLNNVTLGSKASSPVTGSSSDITMLADDGLYNAAVTVNTTGDFVLQSTTDKFAHGFTADVTIQNAHDVLLGKSIGEDVTLTHSGAKTFSGDLVAYGGTIAFNDDLASTDTGDLFIQANTAASTSVSVNSNILKTGGDNSTLTIKGAGRTMLVGDVTATNTGGLNVVLWSDFDGGDEGGVSLGGALVTNGGHVWAGGSDASSSGTMQWNGLTVGNGASVGHTDSNWAGLDFNADISTSDGDVYLWAGAGIDSSDGLNAALDPTINAGTGDITLHADDVYSGTITLETTGHFTYKPDGDQFLHIGQQLEFSGTVNGSDFLDGTGDSDWLHINNFSQLGGLTVGKDGMTSMIKTNIPIGINGPVNLFGRILTIANDVSSSLADAGILFKASDGIIQNNGVDVVSNAGDITYWSNAAVDTSNTSGVGGIYLQDNTLVDSRTSANGTTGGGTITMGGGVATGITANGTTVPSGYALNINGTQSGLILGTNTQSGHTANVDLLSGGGDINLRGRSTQADASWTIGVTTYEGITIDAGDGGDLNMVGVAENADLTGKAIGIDLHAWRNGTTSAAASVFKTAGSGDVLLEGTTTSTHSSSIGNMLVAKSEAASQTIEATGSGSVTIKGHTGGNAAGDIQLKGANILAASGPINIIGDRTGSSLVAVSGADVYIGAKSGSNVASSTSDVLFRSDSVTFSSGLSVDTTGTLTIEPFSDSFSSTLDWPTSNVSVGSSVSGLTIGKATNTAGINISSAQNVAGFINIYGGDIAINGELDTTGGTADGDVLLKATGDITIASNTDISTTGGDVTLWSDSNASLDGTVLLNSGSQIATAGGDITIGGGADSQPDGVPDGAATGQAFLTGNFYSGITLHEATLDTRIGGIFDADAGDISLNGTSTHTGTGSDRAVGVLLYSSKLYGDHVSVTGSVTDTGGATTRYGISSNGGSTPNNTNISTYSDITLSGNAASPADQYSMRWGTNHELNSVNGDITINSDGQLQYLSSQTLTLADGKSLIFNSDYDAEWRNVIDGAGGLNKQGVGELLLTAQNTYTGATAIAAGDLVIRHDTPGITTSEFAGPGSLTVESNSASFASLLNFTADMSGLSELTVGKSTNTANVSFTKDVAADGPITVYGGTLDFAGTIAAGSDDITLAGNDLLLADTVSSTGALLIRPQTSGTTIGVGTGSGSLQISIAELALLQGGFSSITIGSTSAGELQVGGLSSLSDDIVLRAGSTDDLFVTSGLSWNTNETLTLAAGDDINVLSNIDVNGSAAGLNLYYGGTDGTTTPDATDNFYINLANDRRVHFVNTASTLRIGNETYTLLDSAAGLQGMNASGRYALANDISLFGNTYTDAFYTTTFTGKLEGLGNIVDSLKIRDDNGGNLGLFAQLNGATVRHLGVTNVDILTNSATTASDYRIGGLVGNVGGLGSPISNKTLLDGVWTTGTIATKAGSMQGIAFFGGLVGNQNGGTMEITRSFSTANISTQGSNSSNGLGIGGLVGDVSITPNSTAYSVTNSSVVAYDINTSYSTGSIVQGTYGGYFGAGGLLGVNYSTGNTISDSYSWGNVVGTGSFGGIAGFGSGMTATRVYTKQSSFGNSGTYNSSYTSGTLPGATNNGSTLPSGWSSTTWGSGDFPTLVSLGVPATSLFVKVVSGTSVYGDSIAPTYTIVDASGAAVGFGTGIYADVGDATGTGVYTLDSDANASTYDVSYLKGLALTGDDADLYALNPFNTPGSYTVTPRSITAVLGGAGVDKVYDGTVIAGSGFTPTWSFSNILTGDSATLNVGSSFFNDADVLDANLFTINGLSLAGISGSNGSLIGDYALASTTASRAANITAKPIVISSLFANDKIYDATNAATINTSGMTLTGVIGGDNVAASSIAGSFTNKNVGTGKSVSITIGGITGADAGNYSINTTLSDSANISAKAITLSGFAAADKTYDGNVNAAITNAGSLSGVISGDTVTVANSGATFADKNAEAGKTVTLGGVTLSGTDKDNYSIATTATDTADIAAKAITLGGFVAANKTYDGNTTASITNAGSLSGVVSGDAVTASNSGATFTDKNADTGKTVTLNGITLVGTDKDNYSVTSTITDTADIAVKAITLDGFVAADKTYDGNATAAVTSAGSLTGVVSGDTVNVTNSGATFANKNTATGKTVTLGGITLSGTDVNNYSIASTVTDLANIIAKVLTLDGFAVSDKTYDGDATATITNAGSLSGIVSGDTVSVTNSGATFADKNAADGKTVTLSGVTLSGTDKDNYSVAATTTDTADIAAKAITLGGFLAADKTYDGSTTASITNAGSLSGVVSGDTVTASNSGATFANKNAAAGKTVTLNGITLVGTDKDNYSVATTITDTADIAIKAITLDGFVAADKTYDANATASISNAGALTGVVSGDTVTVANTGAAFADKNAATGKTVTLSGVTLSGTDKDNYSVAATTTDTADISAKTITLDGFLAADKTYDGNAVATITNAGSLTGIVSGDTVTVANGGATFADRNAADGKAVTLSGITLSGTDKDNYSVAATTTDTADIAAKAITLNEFLAADKIYDGNTTATITDAGSLSGVVSGDTVTASNSGATFADKNADVGKTVTLNGITLVGTDKDNYSVATTLTDTADIAIKAITLDGFVAADKTYDANATASISNAGSLTGVVSGDIVSVTNSGATFADKNAATGKTVTLTGVTLGGTDKDNYSVAATTTDTADISRLDLVISGVTGVSKVYDGTTSASIDGAAVISPLGGDDVQLDGVAIATFASKNVGNGVTVTAIGYEISGADAPNYTIVQPIGLSADINLAPLVVTAIDGAKFVTKADAPGFLGASYDGFVAGEGLAELGGSLSVTRANSDESAGSYAGVLVPSGLTSGNYDIQFVAGDFGIIPAEQLLVRFGNTESVYGDTSTFSFVSAEYMDSGSSVHSLGAPSVTGNQYTFSDGVGGTAEFTIGPNGASHGTGGALQVGNYSLSALSINESSANFSNTVTIVGNHSVAAAPLTALGTGVSKIYNGTTVMDGLMLGTTGQVAGDVFSLTGSGNYATRNAGTGISYVVENLTLSGVDASSYYLSGGSTLAGNDGVITSKSVTIVAQPVTQIYNGNTLYVPSATELNGFSDQLGVTGDSVESIVLTYDNKNVGTDKTLTPSGIAISDGNGGSNYDITYSNNLSGVITRLDSVTWTGGPTGDWNNPANWAGGATPDLANVANVVIPDGVTPTFGASVPGPVELDSLVGDSLTQDGGTLDVDGSITLNTFTQNGGTVAAGTLTADDFEQTSGEVEVNNEFTIHNSFVQGSTGTVEAGGEVDVTHTTGDLEVHNIVGGGIQLDSTNGGVQLNHVESDSGLEIVSTGDVTQDPSGALTVDGTTAITTPGDVTLDGPNNDFVGQVDVSAEDVSLVDANGGLQLNNVTTTGALDITTNAGDVTQTGGSTISVAGTSTLDADGDIALSGEQNNFQGTVNLAAQNTSLSQSTGNVQLGMVAVDNDFAVTANGGGITQSVGGSIVVGGQAELKSTTEINLLNGANDLQGDVSVNAPTFEVNSSTPVTIVRTGVALADETFRIVAQTSHDALVRPAQASNDGPQYPTSVNWLTRFQSFVTELFTEPKGNSVVGELLEVNVVKEDDDVIIRP